MSLSNSSEFGLRWRGLLKGLRGLLIFSALSILGACGGAGESGSSQSSAAALSLKASPATVANGGGSTLTWVAPTGTSCTASGAWSGTMPASGSKPTGALFASQTYALNCTGDSGSASQSVTVSVSGAPTDGQVQRPSYNTGNGFFVYDGKLYDPNGNEFRLRGVDRCHFDSNSQPGISNSHANAVRMFMYKLSYGAAKYAEVIKTQHIDYNEVPILSMPQFPDGTGTSGNQSTSELASGVSWWVANAATFTPLNKYLIVNIANEWGPKNSTVWRDAYISAVANMRAAGYLGPLLIDAGGAGQDEADIDNYAAAVLASDPQKNLIFAYHLYGGTSTIEAPLASVSGSVITLSSSAATHPFAPSYDGSNNSYSGITAVVIRSLSGELTTVPVLQNVGGKSGAWTITATEDVPEVAAGSTVYDWGNYQMRIPRFAALASQNIMVAITEFGPGNDIGPSPTMVTPGDVISTAESSGVGWLAWAWDDNDLAGGMSNNEWFSMTATGPGIYIDSSNLTTFGREVVLNPNYGLLALAKQASIFD
jgi:hypothetical protein